MDVNREHFVLSPRTLRLLGTFATPLRRAGIQVRSVVGAHAHVLELLAFRTETQDRDTCCSKVINARTMVERLTSPASCAENPSQEDCVTNDIGDPVHQNCYDEQVRERDNARHQRVR